MDLTNRVYQKDDRKGTENSNDGNDEIIDIKRFQPRVTQKIVYSDTHTTVGLQGKTESVIN